MLDEDGEVVMTFFTPNVLLGDALHYARSRLDKISENYFIEKADDGVWEVYVEYNGLEPDTIKRIIDENEDKLDSEVEFVNEFPPSIKEG